MNNRVLTDEKIQEAKKLKEEGKSKRQISAILGIAQTTVWDNVFNNKKRIRVYKVYQRPIETRVMCSRCEILMKEDLNGRYIPHNFRLGEICMKCYLEEKGIEYLELIDYKEYN